ncbi:type VII secretion integral membrane protein EccD [Pseudonocardia sp. RS010]|uniref:type VII secretion integral membrane protein EccD n=1 Tax=Pseudonocardia sp. RS010 TaxID=3385979 RepID=UPI0039A06205
MDAYRRVTVLAPDRRLDVALPADLAVAELVPMLRELLGEPVPAGRAPAPWRLDGPAGAPLPPGATLAQLGVHDGELLRIGPALAPPAPPRWDDLPEALAAAVEAGARGGDDPAGDGALPLAVLAATTAASGLLAAVRGSGPLVAGAAVLAGLGAAAGALVLARVGGPGRPRGLLPALCALPAAAAAGWLLVPGSPTAAALGAGLLLALAAAAAQAVVRVVAPPLVAALLVGTTTSGCAALLLTGGTPAAAGAACAAAGLLAGPALPRLALRLAALPAPEVDVPAPGGPAARPPEPVVLSAGPTCHPTTDAALARRHLAGLVLGTAVVTASGAVLAATGPGWWGRLLAAAVCVVLLLRARGFAEPLPARALQVAGLLGGAAATLAGTLAAPAPLRLLAAATVLGAVLTVLGPQSRPRRCGPVGRRTLDLAELVLTALCVPLAVAALDLFALVRGW